MGLWLVFLCRQPAIISGCIALVGGADGELFWRPQGGWGVRVPVKPLPVRGVGSLTWPGRLYLIKHFLITTCVLLLFYLVITARVKGLVSMSKRPRMRVVLTQGPALLISFGWLYVGPVGVVFPLSDYPNCDFYLLLRAISYPKTTKLKINIYVVFKYLGDRIKFDNVLIRLSKACVYNKSSVGTLKWPAYNKVNTIVLFGL